MNIYLFVKDKKTEDIINYPSYLSIQHLLEKSLSFDDKVKNFSLSRKIETYGKFKITLKHTFHLETIVYENKYAVISEKEKNINCRRINLLNMNIILFINKYEFKLNEDNLFIVGLK